MKRIAKQLLLAVLVASALTACATQPPVTAYDPPGFFAGILHGLIVVPAVVAGFFSDVRIYAFPNSGYWYDVGFVLGASFGLGAAATVATS